MPLETYNVDVTKDAYVLIGSGVTSIGGQSQGGEGIDLIGVAAGSPVPSVGDDKISVDAVFTANASEASDFYAKGTQFSFTIEGMRE